MTDASQRGWGDCGTPDSLTQKRYRSENIVTSRIVGVDWLVHRKFEPILRHLLDDLVVPAIGPLTMRADDWSYAPRCTRGTGPGTSKPCVMSNHAWGLAVDVNATQNVQGGADPDGQFPPDFGDRLHHLKVRWGGDYTSTKDPMHFEFVGTPEEADLIASGIEREGDMPLSEDDLKKIGAVVETQVREENKAFLRYLMAGKGNSVYDDGRLGLGAGTAVFTLADIAAALERASGGATTATGGNLSGTITVTLSPQ